MPSADTGDDVAYWERLAVWEDCRDDAALQRQKQCCSWSSTMPQACMKA